MKRDDAHAKRGEPALSGRTPAMSAARSPCERSTEPALVRRRAADKRKRSSAERGSARRRTSRSHCYRLARLVGTAGRWKSANHRLGPASTCGRRSTTSGARASWPRPTRLLPSTRPSQRGARRRVGTVRSSTACGTGDRAVDHHREHRPPSIELERSCSRRSRRSGSAPGRCRWCASVG